MFGGWVGDSQSLLAKVTWWGQIIGISYSGIAKAVSLAVRRRSEMKRSNPSSMAQVQNL
jgi:hypothetical protein